MKKSNLSTNLKRLVLRNFMLYFLSAALAILVIFFLGMRLVLPSLITDNNRPFSIPPMEFFHLNEAGLPELSDQQKDLMEKNNISIQILDNDLYVIYSFNSDISEGYQYQLQDIVEIMAPSQDMNYFQRTKNYTLENGTTITLLARQEINEAMNRRVWSLVRWYTLIIMLICIGIIGIAVFLFTRSVYMPIQENFRLISGNIAKTPHDSTPVDVKQASLAEAQQVLTVYNEMVDKMHAIRTEKEALESAQHRLIANLSHDLKSPMTAVRGYTELLEQDNLTDEQKLLYLQRIHNSTSDLNNIVELLNEQVKYQAKDYSLHLEHLDMNDFLREICAGYYTIFEKRGFKMDIEIPEEAFYLDFDPVNMRRVYSNLLDNIAEHNSEPTEIQVCTYYYPVPSGASDTELLGMYNIYIKDNGIGITNEQEDKIFEPFYQGDEARTNHHSGLGLYAVKQILEKHDATITFTRENEYKTVFVITFPKTK